MSALELNFKQMSCLGRESGEVFREIVEQVRLKNPVIRVTGNLKLTKSELFPTQAYLLRDFELESSTYQWLEDRVGYSKVLERYCAYDPRLACRERPQHFAVRMLAGIGAVCSGSNIFMFFPEVLGLEAQSASDCMGFEFIDIWSNIFRTNVFPCWTQVFDLESQIALIPSLSCNLERTIFLASVFHEIGHRSGPFMISPAKSPQLKVSSFQLDVLGELSTDVQLALNLSEFPEVAFFVFAQRIFWFGRRGFGVNPASAWIGRDNDSWISAMLWNRAFADGVIEVSGQSFRFHQNKLRALLVSILTELNGLGKALLAIPDSMTQQYLVDEWMKTQVEHTLTGGYVLSVTQRQAFYACQNIVEIPHFAPMLNLSGGRLQ